MSSAPDALQQFLARLKLVATEELAWLGGALRLRVESYLSEQLPPSEYITSVRAVLVTDAGCALMTNPDGLHALPGGRREKGEELEQTLRRELLEETGCTVTWLRPLALLRFHHLTPKPADYAYPYPDFLQPVFAVRGEPRELADDPDGYEQVTLVPPQRLDEMPIPAYQRAIVRAALELLCDTGTSHR